jgi:hypothetical protein
VAVLLNQASNLRFRIEIVRRISDGIASPASLAVEAYVERYRHEPRLAFVPVVTVRKATLLDLDLIHFLESLEEMLGAVAEGAEPRAAALEASVEPPVAIRIAGGPDAFQVEVGIDLLHVLESVGGLEGARGDDLALFRFFANKRAVLAFSQGLLEEFARFPTDPSKVAKGAAE